jgi:hypothetical protein
MPLLSERATFLVDEYIPFLRPVVEASEPQQAFLAFIQILNSGQLPELALNTECVYPHVLYTQC